MAEERKVVWVARLFDPEHEIVATFASDAEMQEWTQQMAAERPEVQRHLHSTPDPWDDSRHLGIREKVKATGIPRVYITRMLPYERYDDT